MKVLIPNIAKLKIWPKGKGIANGATDDSSSSSSDSDDDSDAYASWRNLKPARQRDLVARGYTQAAWDKDDPRLMTFYNEAERDWKQLPRDRKRYWVARGYDKRR